MWCAGYRGNSGAVGGYRGVAISVIGFSGINGMGVWEVV